jgi:hypothetical protein
VSEPISVQVDAVQGLADELAGLSSALTDDQQLCSVAAGSLWSALEGTPGYWASAAGTGWAGVLGLLAERSGAVATTLSAVCEAYRRAEAQRTDELDVLLGRGSR